jgi:hypothetical protein
MGIFRGNRGALTDVTFTANGTSAVSDTYYPQNGGGKGITLFVEPNHVCDVDVYQFDESGVAKLEYTEEDIAANERRPIKITWPWAGGYVRVRNTDNNAGSASIEVAENE